MQKLTALKGKAIYQYKHTRDALFYGKVMKKKIKLQRIGLLWHLNAVVILCCVWQLCDFINCICMKSHLLGLNAV